MGGFQEPSPFSESVNSTTTAKDAETVVNAGEIAVLIRTVMNDRLSNSTQPHLAFEVATLRGYVFSAIDKIEHLSQHIDRGEVTDIQQLAEALSWVASSLTAQLANLDDVRDALKRFDAESA